MAAQQSTSIVGWELPSAACGREFPGALPCGGCLQDQDWEWLGVLTKLQSLRLNVSVREPCMEPCPTCLFFQSQGQHSLGTLA